MRLPMLQWLKAFLDPSLGGPTHVHGDVEELSRRLRQLDGTVWVLTSGHAIHKIIISKRFGEVEQTTKLTPSPWSSPAS